MAAPGAGAALKLLHRGHWRPAGYLTSQGKDGVLETDEAVAVSPQGAGHFMGLACLPVVDLVGDNAASWVLGVTEAAGNEQGGFIEDLTGMVATRIH